MTPLKNKVKETLIPNTHYNHKKKSLGIRTQRWLRLNEDDDKLTLNHHIQSHGLGQSNVNDVD